MAWNAFCIASWSSKPKPSTSQMGDGGRWMASCRIPSMKKLIRNPPQTMKRARWWPQISATVSVSRNVTG